MLHESCFASQILGRHLICAQNSNEFFQRGTQIRNNEKRKPAIISILNAYYEEAQEADARRIEHQPEKKDREYICTQAKRERKVNVC
jgi:hypothetical protein